MVRFGGLGHAKVLYCNILARASFPSFQLWGTKIVAVCNLCVTVRPWEPEGLARGCGVQCSSARVNGGEFLPPRPLKRALISHPRVCIRFSPSLLPSFTLESLFLLCISFICSLVQSIEHCRHCSLLVEP